MAITANDLGSLTDIALALGVHKSTLSRQLRDGVLTNHGTKTRPRVSLAEAEAARAGNLDPSKQRVARVEDDEAHRAEFRREEVAERRETSLNDIRRANLGFDAQTKQLRLVREGGKLVDRRNADEIFFAIGAQVRDGFETMAADFAMRYGAEVGEALRVAGRKTCLDLQMMFERVVAAGSAENVAA